MARYTLHLDLHADNDADSPCLVCGAPGPGHDTGCTVAPASRRFLHCAADGVTWELDDEGCPFCLPVVRRCAQCEATLTDEGCPTSYCLGSQAATVPESKAAHVAETFMHFWAHDREDQDTTMADLLCDLRHYADQVGIDWNRATARSTTHYVAEVTGKEDSDG